MARIRPSATGRGIVALLVIVGAMIARNETVLATAWVLIIVPFAALTGVGRAHARFVAAVVVPIAAALVVVWWGIIGAPPGATIGSNPTEGLRFAIAITARLAILGGILQLCFLTVRMGEFPALFREWRLTGSALVIAIATVVLLPELRLRADQIMTARYARGLVPRPTLVARWRQIPHLLRPLLAWSLRSAVNRADMWSDRGLLARMGDARHVPRAPGSLLIDACLLSFAVVWIAISLIVPHHARWP